MDILVSHSQRRTTDSGQDGGGGGVEQDSMIDVLLRIQKEGDMRVSLNHGVIRAALIVSNKLSYLPAYSYT